jgi:hypothetical protein
MFLLKTRPDIAYSVNRLAMRALVATERDYECLQRILAYLFHTKEKGLVMKFDPNADFVLSAWCDASYATHPDGRSHSGYGFSSSILGSGLFFSRSTRQSNVTLSSTEAEIYAAVEATKDIIWFRTLLEEIQFPQRAPTRVNVNNASMITLATIDELSGMMEYSINPYCFAS